MLGSLYVTVIYLSFCIQTCEGGEAWLEGGSHGTAYRTLPTYNEPHAPGGAEDEFKCGRRVLNGGMHFAWTIPAVSKVLDTCDCSQQDVFFRVGTA